MDWLTSGLCYALIAVAALVIGMSCATIYSASLDVLYSDEWGIQFKLLNDSLVDSLFHKQGQHVIVLPKLLYTLNNAAFSGSSKPLVCSMIAFCAIVSGAYTYWLTRAENGVRRPIDALVVAAVMLAMVLSLWFACRHNRFWAAGFINYLAIVGAVLSSLGVSRLAARGYRFVSTDGALVLVGGLIASLSFGAGLAVWPMLVVLLFLTRAPRGAWLVTLGLATACVLVVALAAGKASPEFSEPAYWWGFLLRFLGAGVPLAALGNRDAAVAWWAGGLGLLALVGVSGLVYKRARARIRSGARGSAAQAARPSTIFYLGPMWFTVFAGCMAALARADGRENFVPPRYGTWTVVFWQAAILFTLSRLLSARPSVVRRLVAVGVMALVLAGVVRTNVNETQRQVDFQSQITSLTLAVVVEPDATLGALVADRTRGLRRIGPLRQMPRILRLMRERSINFFSQDWPHRIGQPFPGDLAVEPARPLRGELILRDSAAGGVHELNCAIDYGDEQLAFESLVLVEQGTVVGVAVPVADARVWEDRDAGRISGLGAWWSTSVGAFRRSVYFSGAVVPAGEAQNLRVFGVIEGGSEQPLRAREVDVRMTHAR